MRLENIFRKGFKFFLKREDIKVPKNCPILGLKLKFNPGRRVDNSYSIDRIDNRYGYTKNNVAIVSWKANRLKNSLTPKEIKNLYEYMRKNKKL